MRLPADIVDVSIASTTSWTFVAGPGDRPSRRPGRTGMLLLLMCLGATFGVEHVALAASGDGVGDGALQVRRVNDGGRATASTPVIDVSDAFPGMAPQSSTFEVRNTGNVPLTFAVTSAELVVSGRHSLDDVLRITVRDRVTGAVEYRGRLSGMHLMRRRALAAGSAATFTVDVTWPSGPNDDAYQGAGLIFSVVANASAV